MHLCHPAANVRVLYSQHCHMGFQGQRLQFVQICGIQHHGTGCQLLFHPHMRQVARHQRIVRQKRQRQGACGIFKRDNNVHGCTWFLADGSAHSRRVKACDGVCIGSRFRHHRAWAGTIRDSAALASCPTCVKNATPMPA